MFLKFLLTFLFLSFISNSTSFAENQNVKAIQNLYTVFHKGKWSLTRKHLDKIIANKEINKIPITSICEFGRYASEYYDIKTAGKLIKIIHERYKSEDPINNPHTITAYKCTAIITMKILLREQMNSKNFDFSPHGLSNDEANNFLGLLSALPFEKQKSFNLNNYLSNIVEINNIHKELKFKKINPRLEILNKRAKNSKNLIEYWFTAGLYHSIVGLPSNFSENILFLSELMIYYHRTGRFSLALRVYTAITKILYEENVANSNFILTPDSQKTIINLINFNSLLGNERDKKNFEILKSWMKFSEDLGIERTPSAKTSYIGSLFNTAYYDNDAEEMTNLISKFEKTFGNHPDKKIFEIARDELLFVQGKKQSMPIVDLYIDKLAKNPLLENDPVSQVLFSSLKYSNYLFNSSEDNALKELVKISMLFEQGLFYDTSFTFDSPLTRDFEWLKEKLFRDFKLFNEHNQKKVSNYILKIISYIERSSVDNNMLLKFKLQNKDPYFKYLVKNFIILQKKRNFALEKIIIDYPNNFEKLYLKSNKINMEEYSNLKEEYFNLMEWEQEIAILEEKINQLDKDFLNNIYQSQFSIKNLQNNLKKDQSLMFYSRSDSHIFSCIFESRNFKCISRVYEIDFDFEILKYKNSLINEKNGGLGVELDIYDDKYVVKKIMSKQHNQLKLGDKILKVNNKFDSTNSFNELRGKVGSEIEVLIQRNDKTLNLKLKRIDISNIFINDKDVLENLFPHYKRYKFKDIFLILPKYDLDLPINHIFFNKSDSFENLILVPGLESSVLKFKNETSQQKQNYLGIGLNNFNKFDQNKIKEDLALRGLKIDYEISNLQNAQDEIENVSSKLKSSKNTLLGNKATEMNLRKVVEKNYDIIHIATHAINLYKSNFLSESALLLKRGKEKSNSLNDGILHTSEILDLNINAQLLILSGCNTLKNEENFHFSGISGISLSFLISGAKSLVVSQWPVADLPTKTLIENAFTNDNKNIKFNLSNGIKVTRKKFNKPIHWAPLILISTPNLYNSIEIVTTNKNKKEEKLDIKLFNKIEADNKKYILEFFVKNFNDKNLIRIDKFKDNNFLNTELIYFDNINIINKNFVSSTIEPLTIIDDHIYFFDIKNKSKKQFNLSKIKTDFTDKIVVTKFNEYFWEIDDYLIHKNVLHFIINTWDDVDKFINQSLFSVDLKTLKLNKTIISDDYSNSQIAKSKFLKIDGQIFISRYFRDDLTNSNQNFYTLETINKQIDCINSGYTKLIKVKINPSNKIQLKEAKIMNGIRIDDVLIKNENSSVIFSKSKSKNCISEIFYSNLFPLKKIKIKDEVIDKYSTVKISNNLGNDYIIMNYGTNLNYGNLFLSKNSNSSMYLTKLYEVNNNNINLLVKKTSNLYTNYSGIINLDGKKYLTGIKNDHEVLFNKFN